MAAPADPRRLLVVIVYCCAAFIFIFGIGMAEIIRQTYIELDPSGAVYGGSIIFGVCALAAYGLHRAAKRIRRIIKEKPLI